MNPVVPKAFSSKPADLTTHFQLFPKLHIISTMLQSPRMVLATQQSQQKEFPKKKRSLKLIRKTVISILGPKLT